MNMQKLKIHTKILHPITLVANVVAVFVAMFIACTPFIHEHNFGILIALFFGTSFGMQTWLYYFKGFKESEWANPKYIASQRFTPELLDQYALFHYKFWSVMKITTVFWLVFTKDPGGVLIFIFLYNFFAVFSFNILHSSKKLPVPEGYIIARNKPFWKPKKVKVPKYDFANKQATGTDLIKYE